CMSLTACKQNPYPESGQIYNVRPPDEPVPMPPWVVDAPALFEIHEGETGELPITVKVDDGTPVVAVEGLPEGAVFDSVALKIVWTPDFDDANDERDPRIVSQEYPIRIVLSSSNNKRVVVQRSVLIKVLNTPREF